MRRLRYCLLALCVIAWAAPARAYVAQPIVIDGTNDFNPANQVEDDTGDTQALCDAGTTRPLDLGKIYLTNDANYLYFGFEYRRYCFGSINLGMAIDVNTAAGGATDPFGRKIAWSTVPFRPDFIMYDVIPNPANTYNYEVLYKWNGASWPVLHDGSNGLGIADADGGNFVEGRILLTDLGVTTGATLHVEWWVTQEGTSKGPLDAACSDNVQMSRFSQTTFDTTAAAEMTCMSPYTVLAYVDNVPPTVSSAVAVNFPLQANKTFFPETNQIDVLFSEPVDATTSQVPGNYSLGGPLPTTVSSAVRDGSSLNLVHLTLSETIFEDAAFHAITVTGVKDLANNTIVNNGTTNVGAFIIQLVTFNGDFRLPFCRSAFAATDTFSIEGSVTPLTFTVADNARMADANADKFYNAVVPFSFPKSSGTGKAEIDLLWKFSHTPAGEPFEPGADRPVHLSSDSGATATINAVWGNEAASDFTDRAMDVIFRVNANSPYLSGTHKLWLAGSQLPLTFIRPGMPMRDDGVFPDQTALDKIFAAVVRFPKCTTKNLSWKVVYDSTATDTVFECPGQGDRSLTLNSALYDTVGTVAGPQAVPARGVNRCTVTDKAVRVVYRVDMAPIASMITAGDTVGVASNTAPLSQPPIVPAGRMADNGVSPDATSGDKVYTAGVTFADSTSLTVFYKFWLNKWTSNGGYECASFGDRNVYLDDLTYSVANPIVLPIYQWDYCANLVDVPFSRGGDLAGPNFAALKQSFPNPFTPSTLISFEIARPGHMTLSIYDVGGRRIAKLVDARLAAGPHSVRWDGRGSDGRHVQSGVYVYELSNGNERIARRLVVTR